MTIRLYCDENAMSHALVTGLRKRGLDVQTALDAGTSKWTDEQQLAFATGRVARPLSEAQPSQGRGRGHGG